MVVREWDYVARFLITAPVISIIHPVNARGITNYIEPYMGVVIGTWNRVRCGNLPVILMNQGLVRNWYYKLADEFVNGKTRNGKRHR